MMKTSASTNDDHLLYGLKKITPENWQAADIDPHYQLSSEEWLCCVLQPQLGSNVPEDVVRLFEIARGSMVYGWFYYALMTLAAEQLFRICETAVTCRCKLAKISADKTFAVKIKDLAAAGHIEPGEVNAWNSARELRNFRSHPDGIMLVDPRMALLILNSVCDRINKLFK